MIIPRRLSYARSIMSSRTFSSLGCPTQESTFAMVKPDGMSHLGEIFERLHSEGFLVKNMKMTTLNKATAKIAYEDITHHDYYPAFQDYITSGPILAMRLRRLDAISHWRKVIGPTDSEKARETHPDTLRALIGTDNVRNAVHGAETQNEVTKYCNTFFSSTSIFKRGESKTPNATLSLTPTFIESGKLGTFFSIISREGLRIDAMKTLHTDEIRSLSPTISTSIQEKLSAENTPSGNVCIVELSHPNGFRTLQEGIGGLALGCGIPNSRFGSDEESYAAKLLA
ncbi:unnamed protein product [Moneuplotes crassus]|uniref:Nucleoside diphosphate kinase-like domain-containing protein n=1 Tax=Euplotes crassus TaxID=5936 RepID=A0AAD1XQF3_EUPCR|nr:unnamed protein product [Moneuplotes crassus]